MPLKQSDYQQAINSTSYINHELILNSKVFFLGIDPSISNTGIVVLNENGTLCGAFNFRKIFVLLHKSKALREDTINRIYKMDNIFRSILMLFKHGTIHISIEGYSYASIGRLAQLGELSGSYKLIALSWDIECLVIPPNNVKKYATGIGLADKEDVKKQAVSEFHEYNIPDAIITSDICDAYYIASILYGVIKNDVIYKKGLKEELYIIRSNILQQGRSGGFNGKKKN